jgi:hypothetical protein
MAGEQANREAYTYSQFSVESQAERDAQADRDARLKKIRGTMILQWMS